MARAFPLRLLCYFLLRPFIFFYSRSVRINTESEIWVSSGSFAPRRKLQCWASGVKGDRISFSVRELYFAVTLLDSESCMRAILMKDLEKLKLIVKSCLHCFWLQTTRTAIDFSEVTTFLRTPKNKFTLVKIEIFD